VAALRRLPVRQRQVVALRLLLDLDTATTAEMLGMSGSTVATHLHRALATLRREVHGFNDQELTR
jgi:RNA polymerase sigma-70 factor (ECF subfamily)